MPKINSELQYKGTRKRTYVLLVTTALDLFEKGAMPSVSELALEAGVSRATAYRYFPTQTDLITAVVNESLGPILTWRPQSVKTEERIDELLTYAFPRMFEHEGVLRAALQASLQQWAQGRSTPLSIKDKRLERGNRKDILTMVTSPMKSEFPQEIIDKVIRAFSVIYGSEIFLVLKDIWKMEDSQVTELAQWMAKAIMNQAVADNSNK
ncbi:TetR/AcrR family transcriptional regulator [Providencia sp. CRE-3FA-0001]|uniref:TetR/AcrR family transcriptional regulator n=1 Tax=Providencia huashanensis TaxID=3037798 RepID=A0AA42FQL9_9GAMM|nr:MULTISPECIES: TetR/AcrR family transcriptional regulator [Providencia]EJD6411944.1 TetR/AcrR family transcriptional regulator [Providencia rettgeri]EJD6664265.1 TetR/AcrR family transcriptional regulator [Providencia rettgeri]ELR5079303.1 TetR/AcrR family transcriptional regulator [Providencia rettgeri]ELR5174947.1 TetR/AcrR family transcriptional regulator [Providencia rettgeri]ELR5197907.1 TetR/AcrR family transcriptional regulator [Providencia rettgeri]